MTSVLTYSPMSDPFASHAAAQAEANAARAHAHSQHRFAQSTPPLALVNAGRVTPTGSPGPDEFGQTAQTGQSSNRHRVSIGHGQGYTPPEPVASTSATNAHAYGQYSVPQSSGSRSTHPAQITPPPASRKRASHNPTANLAQRSPPKAEHLTDEYVLHPSVYAYKLKHPNRHMVGFGPYVLLETLGEGEFGKVKLGVHTEYGVEVAIKLIRRGTLEDQEMANKVEREIDVLKMLKHPNIVRMFDVIDTEKYVGIVIEFAAGGELFDYILANRHLKERDAQKLFAQLISGVDYLHKKHIVHRDLKLENLLLDKHRNIIITDFGFANNFVNENVDLMSTSCGSPCYAAPELVVSEGEYVGSAVDIWSCGIILFAMLSGYLPYDDDPDNPDGDNINLLYKYIVNTRLKFPPHISASAQDLMEIMLVPDPRYRASMEEVMNHPWLAGHQALFERTVEMNEWIFQDQMFKKSQTAKRELNERKRVQKEAHLAKFKQVQRSQSTMPGSSVSDQRRRHRSAMPGSSTMGDFTSGQRTPPLSAIAHSLPPSVIESVPLAPVLTPSPSDVRSNTAVENDSGASSSASLPLASIPLRDDQVKPQNTNRHTIQVEYDGEASYEKMQEAMQHGRDVSDESRVDLPIAAGDTDIEASGSELGHGIEGEGRFTPEPVRADSPTTPRKRSPVADPTTPRASVTQDDIQATPRAMATPKATARDNFDTVPAMRSPTVPGPKAQRTRKGMSLDKFGLAKLLGTTPAEAPPTASARALQASTAVNAKQRQSMRPTPSARPSTSAGPGDDKKSKRKTLSLMTRSNSVREKAPLSARDLNPSSAPPHITTTNTATATTATTAAKATAPTLASPSVTAVDAVAANGKTASSSAAKKVMDWFRRKSIARDTMQEIKTTRTNDSDGSFVRVGPASRVAPSEASSVGAIEEEQEPTVSASAPATVPIASVESLAPQDIRREILAPSPMPESTRQPLAEADYGTPNVVRVSPPRATPTRSKSHGVDAPAVAAPTPASSSSEDHKLRIHTGVLDQSALSSKPPQMVMAEAIRVLMEMGMEVKRENEYRVRCTRVKKRGRGFGSVISIAGGVIGQRESRPPIPSSPSSTSILSPGGIRGMLRRGSTTPGQVTRQAESLGLASPAPSSIGTAYSPALPSATFEPIYGEHTVDSGDEVRFNVELCRIKNLPGLYLLNIKRLRGSVWSFKFIYQTVIERCDTLTH